MTKPTSLRLVFDVNYAPNGVSPNELQEALRHAASNTIENGVLTGSSPAEVIDYSITVNETKPVQDEKAMAEFIQACIENGDIDMNDIPVRLARYGLMEPHDFTAEINECVRSSQRDGTIEYVYDFAEQFGMFVRNNQDVLDAIKSGITHFDDDLSDLLDDCAGDMKTKLGAEAANQCSADPNHQEEAIQHAESWVTDNVCNSNLDNRLAAVLWINGHDAGIKAIKNVAGHA